MVCRRSNTVRAWNSVPSELKTDRIRPEHDRGTRWCGRAAGVGPDPLQLALRPAALRVLLPVAGPVLVDLDDQALGQRVDDGHAHAVEPARHLVAAAAELATRMQDGEHDLDRALALVRAGRVGIDRDAAAVVVHPAAAVGLQGHDDAAAVAGHRLVDRVVDDLPDEVVQSGQPGRADVHAGPLADGVQALQDLDGRRVVLGDVVGSRPSPRRDLSGSREISAEQCLATPIPVPGERSGPSSRWPSAYQRGGTGRRSLGPSRRSGQRPGHSGPPPTAPWTGTSVPSRRRGAVR